MTKGPSGGLRADAAPALPRVGRRVKPIGLDDACETRCESLASWLMRCAVANGFEHLRQLVRMAGFHSAHLDLPQRPHLLAASLSEVTGRSQDEVVKMMLRMEPEPKNRDFTARLWVLCVSKSRVEENDGMRHVVCPRCLQDDPTPYWRKYWRFSFTTTCLIHRTPMQERCARCRREFVIGAFSGTRPDECPSCKAPITTASDEVRPRAPCLIERALWRLFLTERSGRLRKTLASPLLRRNVRLLLDFMSSQTGRGWRATPNGASWPDHERALASNVLDADFGALTLSQRREILEALASMSRTHPVALWQILNFDCMASASHWLCLVKMVLFQAPSPMRWDCRNGHTVSAWAWDEKTKL